MTQELDLATQSLAWIVAPTGILIAVCLFAARYLALLRALMAAVKAFCEGQRVEIQRRAVAAAPASAPSEKGTTTAQRLVWLARDRDRFRAEGFDDLRTAALELGKSAVPFVALVGCGILLAAPWNPASSPITYFSGLLHPETPPADTSLEFIADAGVRFQGKISELDTALTATRSERDRLAAQLSSLKAAIASADLSPAQRRALLSPLDRPAGPTPPTIATTGAPATSVSSGSSTPTATPKPPPAPPAPPPSANKTARSREIVKELTTRWAACANELETISNRGPDGVKFANWVQPRLLTLLRSESDKETDLVLRELLAAFDTDKRLVAASPILARVDQLLRQLDILRHGS